VEAGETMASFLRKRTEEGARLRYRPYHERARRQIERELALIEKLKLEGYFLIVWDIVQFCRANNILVQGRGSAANSAVCYSLGITAVDPVGMELLFERFLSEERGEWPDIDLDLPSGGQRERVIQHVYQRYGQRGAAMTANVITYRGRSAAREIGKVLGFDEETCGRLSSLVPVWGWTDPEETPRDRFREAGLDVDHPRVRKFYELYLAAQDLPRHLGQHSGGMVICQGQLDRVVPLEPATMPGRVVVQWDKEDCADLGIVKVDLLGLGMMAVLEESIARIRESYGEEVDLAHLPADDRQVYEALQKADTIGMFQVESRAQMSCLPRLKPKKFYDIVVQVALIRPGPIVGKMVHPYLNRRQGREAPECLHPSLEPVLRRTLGVPLFQEQLLRMAMIAAGFTGGQAEELRRAMGFKRSEKRMREIETKLREGMTRNGIDAASQEKIVQSITSFALYGFPESHAASFALIAYASAYLKCHYPAAFTAALLNNQPMGFYSPATLVKDARRRGVRVRPVSVAESFWECRIEADGALRLGFTQVQGLRQDAAQALLAERRRRPFASVADLKDRVTLSADALRSLAEIGALNDLTSDRRTALWQVERPSAPGLWRQPAVTEANPEEKSPLKPMDAFERVAADYSVMRLTTGPHPMALIRDRLPGVWTAEDLKQVVHGQRIRVGGQVICRQRPGTAKGVVFLSLEDETGISNVIISSTLFEQDRLRITQEAFLIVEGIAQVRQGTIHLKAERFEALEYQEASVNLSHDFH
jgi:error-prone DNA polymerase